MLLIYKVDRLTKSGAITAGPFLQRVTDREAHPFANSSHNRGRHIIDTS
jgi:hypothetical protein